MSDYVLDASVAISALRARDVNHARAASYVAPLLQGIDSLVVPAIFEVEVIATLARAGYSPTDARKAADLFIRRARIVTLGARGARAAARIAARTRLRAGDALYAWVADHEELPLITFDREILERADNAGIVVLEP